MSPSHTDLAAIDRARIIHPYLPATTSERVIMARGKGSSLWDVDGREYLDATGGLWLAQIGHGRTELADVASAQMRELEYFTSFWEFSNPPAIRLADRLATLAPDTINHVYFTSGGSEGIEAALKMARYHHHRRGEGSRTWILARHRAYHGIAYGGGTASGFPVFHDGFGPMLPHVEHLTPPWPYRRELFDGDDCTDFCIRELEQTIERIGADNIAAMIGEPIMGVAGMVVPPDDYWPRVQEVLHKHGILLIFDEVVTAYGRVGAWFAAQRFNVQPDIIVTAKGITSGYFPLGAVLVGDQVAESLGRDHGFPMGYTYNGHPTGCAVALANLDIIAQEGLLARADEIGTYLKSRLTQELRDLPVVGEIRGVGMMLGIELVTDTTSRTPLPGTQGIADAVRRDHAVIVRDSAQGLVLSPALTLEHTAADRIAVALRDVLSRTGPDGVVKG
ncbi:aspartate aminotransferase family protein [Phytoactinopolyspora limicola]|uniref:aminotransferase family protein n=1 Tax=Phytoactinopolyspora limicola TaxID=2715536 RepID=UPI00140A7959|nr:aspartate aminotransferase family protein [Phytoactinopolyspora limicola]